MIFGIIVLISERGVTHTVFVHRTMVSKGIVVRVEHQIMALTQTNRETYTDSSLFIKRFALRELKNTMEEYHRVLTSLCQAGFHLKEVLLKRILLGVERITEQTCYVWKLDSFVSAYI